MYSISKLPLTPPPPPPPPPPSHTHTHTCSPFHWYTRWIIRPHYVPRITVFNCKASYTDDLHVVGIYCRDCHQDRMRSDHSMWYAFHCAHFHMPLFFQETYKHNCISIIFRWRRYLTHWGRVTYGCASKQFIISSDNGLSPGRHQAIIWTNVGIL